MSKFDIYVKACIVINYKTKQPSNLAWNISLTSWLCKIGIRFSIHLSVCPSVNSSVMSKFDIYVRVSILINYKTKQPSNLAWNISLTSWLCDIGICFSVRSSIHLSVRLSTFMLKFDIYVKVSILTISTTRLNNHQTLHETSPDLLTLRHRRPLFHLSVCLSICQHLCQSLTFMSKLVF